MTVDSRVRRLLAWLLTPSEPGYSCWDISMWLLSVTSYLLGVALNTRQLTALAAEADWSSFAGLLGCMVVPHAAVHVLSLLWLRADGDGRVGRVQSVWHALQLGVLLRMCRALVLGCRAGVSGRQDDWHRFYQEQADAALLRLLLVYGGSAPQLVVRMHSAYTQRVWDWQTGFLVVTLVSLAYSAAGFTSAMRRHRYDKRELCRLGLASHTLYRLCLLVSRVVALTCLFTLSPSAGLAVTSAIYIALLVWLSLAHTRVMQTAVQEVYFRAVIAFVLLFGFLNFKETDGRFRYAFYYSLSLIGELLVVATFLSSDMPLAWLAVTLCLVSFALGMLFHVVDHSLFHPASGRLYRPRVLPAPLPPCHECYRCQIVIAEGHKVAEKDFACAA